MDREKVTDIEIFFLEQILRPYANQIDVMDLNLGNIQEFIKRSRKHRRWWKRVKSRISGCGFYFPDYIKHPLVELLKEEQDD